MDLEFDVADIQPAHEAQVVAGMFYDRRVFLVVRGNDARPLVLAFTPHQAAAIARDLASPAATGDVHGQGPPVEPRVTRG